MRFRDWPNILVLDLTTDIHSGYGATFILGPKRGQGAEPGSKLVARKHSYNDYGSFQTVFHAGATLNTIYHHYLLSESASTG